MIGPTWTEVLVHMIWPVSCPVCGLVGRLLCDSCIESLLKPQLPRCLWCGRRIPCKLHAGDAKIRAGAVYEGYMRDLILMLKHARYEALGIRIGNALGGFFEAPSADFLVPVPLHEKSRRRYNQAEAIAAGLGRRWGVEVWDAARWIREVGTRAGMKARQRRQLFAEAFDVDPKIGGARIVLVDDVCTTGTTLSRLGAACREAGADVRGAFVAAYVPEHA